MTAPKTPKSRRMPGGAASALRECTLEHGGEYNSATLYGHAQRTCIRLKALNVWVFDPAWETRS